MRKILMIGLAGLLQLSQVFGQLKLPAIFSDNMVLQQSTDAPIWGWAKPGAAVRVQTSWSDKVQTTVAGANGRWKVQLRTPAAGGPFSIQVKADRTINLNNILTGEVWICSGQSNMEMPVSGFATDSIDNSKQEIARSENPQLRLFTVDKQIAYRPKEDLKGQWQEARPETVAGFSATAYFFGKELYERLGVPIGLIHTSWGGTIAEAWTSEAALRLMGDFDKELNTIDTISRNIDAIKRRDSLRQAAWLTAAAAVDATKFTGKDIHNWKTMSLPSVWEAAGLPDMDGLVWFKKIIRIPENWAGRDLKLDLGPIDDRDIFFFNGVAVDSTVHGLAWAADRHYTIPGRLVKAGVNVIAIRVTDDGGNGGLYGKKDQLRIYSATEGPRTAITLDGQWYYRVAAVKYPPQVSNWPNQPAVLYNAMIAPLVPYAIKGAIWYQGESNVGRAKQYSQLFPLMIKDWRKRWKRGAFPFYFVQIAPFKYGGDATAAAQLRDAQRRTLTALPNTGMAVTLDIGNPDNIHPSNKQDVGSRLAAWALHNTYGHTDLIYSGPLYQGFKVEGDKLIVSFTHCSGGLKSVDDNLKGFEIRSGAGDWVPATASIKGNTVTLYADRVKNPDAVRYAFYAASTATLFNGAGLPASSFTSAALQ